MPSDAELVRAAQTGDATSLGLLLERYRASLYGLALRILGHGQEAQDAVHDTFLVALRKLDQVREPAAVGGWLHASLRNVCRMRLRADQGEILFDETSHYVEHRAFESSVEESMDRLALREWVWTALSKLPEGLRVTAMLRYFGSYASYGEISAILGVPEGTVKSRLNQVKVKLADALLEAAGLEHGEARQITESQTRYFEAAFDEMDRKGDCQMFASAFSDDLEWALTNDPVRRGRTPWVHLFELDVEDGVRHPITNVLASKDVTIIEVDQINPPEDPFHCPPAISIVGFYRGGLIDLMRAYEPPRHNREGR